MWSLHVMFLFISILVDFPEKQLRRFINDQKASNKNRQPDINCSLSEFQFPVSWYKTGPVILDQKLCVASKNTLLLFYAKEGLSQYENASKIAADCTFRVPKEFYQVLVLVARKSEKDSCSVVCFMTSKSASMYNQFAERLLEIFHENNLSINCQLGVSDGEQAIKSMLQKFNCENQRFCIYHWNSITYKSQKTVLAMCKKENGLFLIFAF